MEISCPKCGWSSRLKYLKRKKIYKCEHCGNEFTPVICNKCGNQLAVDSNFCPKCGNKVEANV